MYVGGDADTYTRIRDYANMRAPCKLHARPLVKPHSDYCKIRHCFDICIYMCVLLLYDLTDYCKCKILQVGHEQLFRSPNCRTA